ncbi:MAG: helix-turn-helix domain-containing protein [Candidatus Schekmanbacteria bacterium]|nr:helix-turn-helix domain-containing protein [Candidatus Schekmanbacteria bacterium]
MQNLGQRIRHFREIKGMSQSELEKHTGIKREYLSKLENDELKNPTYFTMLKISKGMGINISDLVEPLDFHKLRQEPVLEIVSALKKDKRLEDKVSEGSFVAVPIVNGEVAAGNPTYINERDIEDYALIHSSYVKETEDYQRYRCTWVAKNSRSMYPIINPGTLVCIDSQQKDPEALEGKIVVLRDSEGGCTIRYLRLSGKHIVGVPENIREYNPLLIPVSEKNPIVGRIVWYWSKLDD